MSKHYSVFENDTHVRAAKRWTTEAEAQIFINQELDAATWHVGAVTIYTDEGKPPMSLFSAAQPLVAAVWAEAMYWRARAEKAESTTKDLQDQWAALRKDVGLDRCTS
jgi:hypothetical protein